ncbi:MAG: homocysteine S-methyltransferase family protein [Myxococcota bacterium]
MLTVLDGPLGTELSLRGVDTRLPLWSARALLEAPERVAEVHRAYAEAGATVHTTNTFRTRRETLGDAWAAEARHAVRLCREAIAPGHRVAGGLAPLADCYRPDLSPATEDPKGTRTAHRALADVLAEDCDLLLCETFPHADEALLAVEAAVATGRETWLALTAGPDADLMTPEGMGRVARRAADAGAAAVLVNCISVPATAAFVAALAAAAPDVPVGAYANAGRPDEGIGWEGAPEPGARAYAGVAESWVAQGASIIGGCCGTGPAHVAALAMTLGGPA